MPSVPVPVLAHDIKTGAASLLQMQMPQVRVYQQQHEERL